MSDGTAIILEGVTKSYPMHSIAHVGLKSHLLTLPERLFKKRTREVFYALRNATIHIRRGECFGLIGRNGSGKSTALSLIAGVIRPDSGKVRVQGRISPLLELGAGFQQELTGRENILLNGVLLGMTRREVRLRADRIIEFAELGPFIEEPIRTYSMGMLARLGFAVASHVDPEILLVDEILAVGDMAFSAKCMEKIAQFRSNGVTICFVTHDLNTLRANCDRAAHMRDGRVVFVGETSAVIEGYNKVFAEPSVRVTEPDGAVAEPVDEASALSSSGSFDTA